MDAPPGRRAPALDLRAPAGGGVRLEETGPKTGVFLSGPQLLVSSDRVSNPDDALPVEVTDGMGTGMRFDEEGGDPTHRVTVDGSVGLTWAVLAEPGTTTRFPVCARGPSEQRRVLRLRFFVLLEPWLDSGCDCDGDPATPLEGVGNGVFDWDDANGNGVHDLGERSEAYYDFDAQDPDGSQFAENALTGSDPSQTGSRGGVSTQAEIDALLWQANLAWAQACVRVEQLGMTEYIEAPDGADGRSVLFDQSLQILGYPWEAFDIWNALAATLEQQPPALPASPPFFAVAFVGDTGGATGLAVGPDLLAGFWSFPPPPANLPPQSEQTLLLLSSGLTETSQTLEHEIGHGLTNFGHSSTPGWQFYPTEGGMMVPASEPAGARRLNEQTAVQAVTDRPLGDYTGLGNRVLRAP